MGETPDLDLEVSTADFQSTGYPIRKN